MAPRDQDRERLIIIAVLCFALGAIVFLLVFLREMLDWWFSR